MMRSFKPKSMMCSEGTSFRLSAGGSAGLIVEDDYSGVYMDAAIAQPPNNGVFRFLQIENRAEWLFDLTK